MRVVAGRNRRFCVSLVALAVKVAHAHAYIHMYIYIYCYGSIISIDIYVTHTSLCYTKTRIVAQLPIHPRIVSASSP